jgi:hypothetical protein
MPQVTSVLTAIAWIPLFAARVVALRGEGLRFFDIATVTVAILVVCVAVALSIWSALRPQRLTAWALLVLSLAPACFVGPIAWQQVRGYGLAYLVSLSWTVAFWLCESLFLVVLPFLLIAVCWRLRHGVVNRV